MILLAESIPIDEIIPGPVGSDTEDQQQADNLHKRCIAAAFQIKRNLKNLCVDLSLIYDNKFYLLLGSTSFNDYCETSLKISKATASKYCTVGRFIRQLDAVSPEKQNITNCNNFVDLGITKMYMLATLTTAEFEVIEKDNDILQLTKKELKAKIDDIHLMQKVKEQENFTGSVGELKKSVEELVTDFNNQSSGSDERHVSSGVPSEIMDWYRMILELRSMIDRMDSYFNQHSDVLFDMVVPIRFERLIHALILDKKTCEDELYGDD